MVNIFNVSDVKLNGLVKKAIFIEAGDEFLLTYKKVEIGTRASIAACCYVLPNSWLLGVANNGECSGISSLVLLFDTLKEKCFPGCNLYFTS